MSRTTKSALRVLVEDRFKAKGKSLTSLVKSERAAGQSWQAVANTIHARVGVTVTAQTLNNWFGDSPSQSSDVA